MSNLSLVLFFFFFSCVFLKEKIEAFDTIVSAVNNLQNVLGPITNTAQLPVKYPLPPVGTTSCSTYPHADKGIENFQQLCYTQLYLRRNGNYNFRCRTSKFTVGLPLAEVPFQIPEVVGFTPQAGYAFADAISKTNSSQHLSYNYSFVETETGEQTYFMTAAANLSVIFTGLITSYTDKGYVFTICPLDYLRIPLCSPISDIYLCTYAQFPPQADLQALVQPLNQYPYNFGNSLRVMNQTGCT